MERLFVSRRNYQQGDYSPNPRVGKQEKYSNTTMKAANTSVCVTHGFDEEMFEEHVCVYLYMYMGNINTIFSRKPCKGLM